VTRHYLHHTAISPSYGHLEPRLHGVVLADAGLGRSDGMADRQHRGDDIGPEKKKKKGEDANKELHTHSKAIEPTMH